MKLGDFSGSFTADIDYKQMEAALKLDIEYSIDELGKVYIKQLRPDVFLTPEEKEAITDTISKIENLRRQA